VSGNYIYGSTSVTANNWSGVVMNGGTAADTTSAKALTEFSFSPITTQTADVAYTRVLDSAGVILPRRDTLDQRIMNDVKNGTGSIIDVQGGYPHGTAYNATVNAWPTLTSFTAPVDTDGDGMPDWWERKYGLNPSDASDRSTVGSDGYTMLEKYINSIPSADSQSTFDTIYAGRSTQLITAINFKTGWTKNLYTYGLYRSTDNINFTRIATVTGNSDSINFRLVDSATPYSNTVYYKIGSYKTTNATDTTFSNAVIVDNGNDFYNKASGDISLPTSWSTKADGSGSSPVTALNNTSGNFHIRNTTTLTGTLSLLKASNLYIENNTTLTIGTGGYLTMGPQSVLTVNSGSTFNVNGNSLTLQSSAAGTASLIGNSSANGGISNATNVTIQRFITARRAFRFLASPATTTNFITANWQSNFGIANNFGTHITGAAGTVGTIDATTGFDATPTGAPSMFTFNTGTQNWQAIANTNATNLQAGMGYRLLARGDRTISLNTNTPPPLFTIL